MTQIIVSAFSFEMIKQNDDFFKLFFCYVSGQDYLTNGKRLNGFLTTKNIVESQTRLMECCYAKYSSIDSYNDGWYELGFKYL